MTDDAKTYVKRLRDREAKEAAILAARINANVLAKIHTKVDDIHTKVDDIHTKVDDIPRSDIMAVKIVDRDTEIIKILSRKDIEYLLTKGYILKRIDGTIIDTLKDT